jgi:hypothetical protein
MAAADEINEANLSPEAVMARFVAERGDIFEEFHFIVGWSPLQPCACVGRWISRHSTSGGPMLAA